MKAHNTSANPRRPTAAIVTTGPFRFTRNPLYLSLTLIVVACACFADSLIMLLLTVPLVATLQLGVILPEERYLERKFGDDYRRYRAEVRRWL